MRKNFVGSIVFLVFLVVGIVTFDNYGISWDSPVHFRRGQSYLNFFLTGKESLGDFPEYNLEKAQTDPDYHERSFYQTDDVLHTGRPLKEIDMGHPVLGDILMAVFNKVFYQQLGVVWDIGGYNLFIIFCGALAVLFVFLFAYEAFGIWPAIYSSFFLATYPLFWAESHFNIKDIPETAFITATIYYFWRALVQKRPRLLITSAIMAGIALGIKFNIIFVGLIFLVWLVYLWSTNRKNMKNFLSKKKVYVSLFVFPIIMLGILYISWPYLWNDPVGNFMKTIGYYKGEGANILYQPGFTVGIINIYPLVWVLLTTNPFLIAFFLIGLFLIKNQKKGKKEVLILWLLWFLIPILRVTYSRFSIYGGVRQIMEYVPAMALIAGVGADWLMNKFRKPVRLGVAAVIASILVATLIRIHPNENVYFNIFAGGLKGAVEKDIPAAGNTFGNAYKYGIKWINENAPKNAKLALIQGATSNLPLFELRSDIDYSNTHFSGIERGGEYLMELTYNSETRAYHYAWEYVDKLLIPVYEYKAEAVPVLKIWKNELANTKEDFQKTEKEIEKKVAVGDDSLTINFANKVQLTRVFVEFDESCIDQSLIFVEVLIDKNKWIREKDWVPSFQLGRDSNLKGNAFTFYFAAKETNSIRLITEEDSCLLTNPGVKVYAID